MVQIRAFIKLKMRKGGNIMEKQINKPELGKKKYDKEFCDDELLKKLDKKIIPALMKLI